MLFIKDRVFKGVFVFVFTTIFFCNWTNLSESAHLYGRSTLPMWTLQQRFKALYFFVLGCNCWPKTPGNNKPRVKWLPLKQTPYQYIYGQWPMDNDHRKITPCFKTCMANNTTKLTRKHMKKIFITERSHLMGCDFWLLWRDRFQAWAAWFGCNEVLEPHDLSCCSFLMRILDRSFIQIIEYMHKIICI